MDITIQQASDQDAERISELINQFTPLILLQPDHGAAEGFLESISPGAIRGYIEDPEFDYFIATDGAVLAGVAALKQARHLYHLFVAAEYQRKGIARNLWQRLQCCVNAQIETITVNSSLFAVPIYQHFGFETSGARVEKDGIAYVPMKMTRIDS